MKAALTVVALAVLFLGFNFLYSETYDRRYHPCDYWNARVVAIEKSIEQKERSIKLSVEDINRQKAAIEKQQVRIEGLLRNDIYSDYELAEEMADLFFDLSLTISEREDEEEYLAEESIELEVEKSSSELEIARNELKRTCQD